MRRNATDGFGPGPSPQCGDGETFRRSPICRTLASGCPACAPGDAVLLRCSMAVR